MKNFTIGLLIVALAAAAIVIYPRLKPSTPSAPAPSENDQIRVTNPQPNEAVSSPLIVRGEARGTWYFEASFSVYLYDGNGDEIAAGIAQARSDWMTEDFVQFTATLEFDQPSTSNGTLVFKKDNPSGLPEFDDAFSIPVLFN